MAAQIFGSAATVLEMNIALFGLVPSNNAFNNQLSVVGTNNANLFAYVNQITNTNYAGVADSALATAVLNNVLGTDPANNATLNAALTSLLAANPANRGVVIYQVVTALTTLEGNATYGAAAKIFNQEVTNGNVYSSDPNSGASTPPNPNPPVVVGKTFVLTASVDAPVGTAADDLFIGTEATLGSGDTLSGGGGNDTLKFASSGAVAVNKAGFATTGIATALVTSDAVGGTNFDVTGMTGTTALVNDNSSTDVTFNGAANLMSAKLQNVSGGNTQFIYQSGVVAGANDTMSIALANNKTIAGGTIGTVTANGIENFIVTTSGGASVIQELASAGSLKSITVSGDQNLTLGAANFSNTAAANTVDASKLTGNLNLTLSNDGAANIAVAVTGGSGNDRVSFTTFDKGDAFTGGTGTDTIALTNAVATGSPAGTLSGVETLEDTDASVGTINMSNFSGVTNVFLSKGLAGNTVVSNATTGITETVNVGTAAAADLTTTLKTDGTADAISLVLNNVDKASTLGNVVSTGFESVSLNASVVSGLNGTGALTIANLNDATATTLNVNSGVNLTVTASNTGSLTKVDASASTGNLTLNSLTFSTAGATIIGGKGNDKFTPGTGADTITLGTGADVLTYSTTTQSNDKMDIVTDFTSGTDVLNLAGLGLIGSTQYLGSRSSFGLAQGALTAGGATSAVLDSSTNILWVDSNGDGTLDNRDFRIQLNGVTTLTAADLNLSAAGSGISVTGTNASVSKTLSTNATGTTTDLGDTINTKVAYLATGTVDGAAGTDTLVMQDAGAVAITANYTNTEALTLNTTGSTANTVTFAGGAFKSITGSDNADTVTTANMVAGGSISLGAGNDVVTLSANLAGSTIDLGAGDDSLTIGAIAAPTTTMAGGAGSDTLTQTANGDLTGATISGFEILDNGGFTTTITTAQYTAIATQVKGAGAITFSDSGAVSDLAASTSATYILASGGQSFTANAAVNYTITGGAGNDTVTFKAGWTGAGDLVDLGAGTADKVVMGYDVAGPINLNTAAGTLANVEQFATSVNQTGAAGTFVLTLDAALNTVDLSAQTTTTSITANAAVLTSLKLGASNDTIDVLTTGTTATAVDFGAGNDTIQSLITDTGAVSLTFGSGNDVVTDFTTHGTGVVTLKFGTPTGTETLNFAATTKNFAVNDVFDFVTNATSIVSGAPTGATGVAGAVGQVFVDTTTTAGSTIITFDADGSRTFSVGDVQITVTGNVLTFGIDASGNLVVSASA